MIYITDHEVTNYSWGELGHTIYEVNVLKLAGMITGKPPTFLIKTHFGVQIEDII